MPEKPERPDPPAERRLTTEQFELVIRRAAELQATASDDGGEPGMTEAELLRIGREIGIAPQHLRRALAESGAPPPKPPALVERVFGPGWVRAARAVPLDADRARERLDEYLVKREWLAPVRRLPDRAIYEKARGVELARVLQAAQSTLFGGRDQPQVGAGFELRKARRVEVGVQPLEEGYSYVTLAADLGNQRTGLAAGAAVGGGTGAVAVASVLAVAVDPVAALLGIPVLGGSLLGARTLVLHLAERAGLHLEGVLDCLERGEPLVRYRSSGR